MKLSSASEPFEAGLPAAGEVLVHVALVVAELDLDGPVQPALAVDSPDRGVGAHAGAVAVVAELAGERGDRGELQRLPRAVGGVVSAGIGRCRGRRRGVSATTGDTADLAVTARDAQQRDQGRSDQQRTSDHHAVPSVVAGSK
jgi:hypothetical protein